MSSGDSRRKKTKTSSTDGRTTDGRAMDGGMTDDRLMEGSSSMDDKPMEGRQHVSPLESVLQVMQEQMRLHQEQMKAILEAIARGQGAGTGQSSTAADAPNLTCALSNRIEKFTFDPEANLSFSHWYARYKDVFIEDAKPLTESARVRLLCEKLDRFQS